MMGWLVNIVKTTNFDNRGKIEKNNYFEPFVFNQTIKKKRVKSMILINELKTDKLINLSKEEKGSDRIRLFYRERLDKWEERFSKNFFLKNVLKYEPTWQFVDWGSAESPFKNYPIIHRALGAHYHFSNRLVPFTYMRLDGCYGLFKLKLLSKWSELWNLNFNTLHKGLTNMVKIHKWHDTLNFVNIKPIFNCMTGIGSKHQKFLNFRFLRKPITGLNRRLLKIRLRAYTKPYDVLNAPIHKRRRTPFRLFKIRKRREEKRTQKKLKRLRKKFKMVLFEANRKIRPYKIYDQVKRCYGTKKINKVVFSIHEYYKQRGFARIYSRIFRSFSRKKVLWIAQPKLLRLTLLNNISKSAFFFNTKKLKKHGKNALKCYYLNNVFGQNFLVGINVCEFGSWKKNLFNGFDFDTRRIKIVRPVRQFFRFNRRAGKFIRLWPSKRWLKRGMPRFELNSARFVKGVLFQYFRARVKLLMLILRPLLAFMALFKDSPMVLKKYARKQAEALKRLSGFFTRRIDWFMKKMQAKVFRLVRVITVRVILGKYRLGSINKKTTYYLKVFFATFSNLLKKYMAFSALDTEMRNLFDILQDTEFRELDKFGRPDPDWAAIHDEEFFDEEEDVGITYRYYRDEFLEGLGLRYTELGGSIYNRSLLYNMDREVLAVGQNFVKLIDFKSLNYKLSRNFTFCNFLTRRSYRSKLIYYKFRKWRFNYFFGIKSGFMVMPSSMRNSKVRLVKSRLSAARNKYVKGTVKVSYTRHDNVRARVKYCDRNCSMRIDKSKRLFVNNKLGKLILKKYKR